MQEYGMPPMQIMNDGNKMNSLFGGGGGLGGLGAMFGGGAPQPGGGKQNPQDQCKIF